MQFIIYNILHREHRISALLVIALLGEPDVKKRNPIRLSDVNMRFDRDFISSIKNGNIMQYKIKIITFILCQFFAFIPSQAQTPFMLPEVSDSTYFDAELYIGGGIYENIIPPFWNYHPFMRGILPDFTHGIYNYYGFGRWNIPEGHKIGFTYGHGEAYLINFLLQLFDDSSSDSGSVVFNYKLFSAGPGTREDNQNLFDNGVFIINNDSLWFSDAILIEGLSNTPECYLLTGVYNVSKFTWCWPHRPLYFSIDDIVRIRLVAPPTMIFPGPPAGLRFSKDETPGAVWLSWFISCYKPRINNCDNIFQNYWLDPKDQLNHEKTQGIYYEYKVLRDGDKQWKPFLVEDTLLDGTELYENFHGRHIRQRRKYRVTGLDPEGEYSFCIRAVNAMGTSKESCDLSIITPVSSYSENVNLPQSVRLGQNYPNPFNPSTTIEYKLSKPEHVRLEVFDAAGRSVTILADGMRPLGRHSIRFEAGNLPSGVYVYRLQAGTQTLMRKMMLIR